MKIKALISAVAILGVMSGPATTFGAEPKSHDHRATKGYPSVPSSEKEKSAEKCIPSAEESSDKKDGAAEVAAGDQSENCETTKRKTQNHDHREMKN